MDEVVVSLSVVQYDPMVLHSRRWRIIDFYDYRQTGIQGGIDIGDGRRWVFALDVLVIADPWKNVG